MIFANQCIITDRALYLQKKNVTNKLGSGKDGRGDRFFSNGNPQPHLLAGINRAPAYDSTVSFRTEIKQ